jgi:hypothetical protein
MTTEEFNKEKNKIYNKYNTTVSNRYEREIKTPFGTLYISSGWIEKIKLANIHSRLEGDKEKFKEVTGYKIDTYNGKYNTYYNNPKDSLDELEEYLSNITYLGSKIKQNEKNI